MNYKEDLQTGFKKIKIPYHLAKQDIIIRFRLSVLGPIWITISTGLFIASLTFIMNVGMGAELLRILPHLSTGLIIWTFIQNSINDSCTVYISNRELIKNLPIAKSIFIFQFLIRNFIIFIFNLINFVIILIFFKNTININILYLIPNFILFFIMIINICLLISLLATRFNDILQMVGIFLQIFFFITPIFWLPDLIEGKFILLDLNPLYHLVELIRAPLLGYNIKDITLIYCLTLSVILSIVSYFAYKKNYSKIIHWL